MQREKQCTKCGETKPLDGFHRDKTKAGGRRGKCKECSLEYARRYREENRDKLRECQRRYYEENRDELLEYAGHYREENREKVRECNRRYYEENHDKVREYNRRYYEENRDKELERGRRQYEENINYMRAQKRKEWRSNNAMSALLATNHGEPYTPDEDVFLMAENGMTTYQKAVTLGRTYQSCSGRLHLLRRREAADV